MRRFGLFFLLSLMLISCQSSKVAIDYDTQTDFSQLQTYVWQTSNDNTDSSADTPQDPLLTERARQAISKAMPLQKSTSEETADVLLRFQLNSVTQTEEPKTRGGIGLGSAGGSTGVGISLSLPLGKEKVVKRVQLVIDFLNPDNQRLLWRGTNQINIGEDSPEEISQKINAAVSEILARYPPQ